MQIRISLHKEFIRATNGQEDEKYNKSTKPKAKMEQARPPPPLPPRMHLHQAGTSAAAPSPSRCPPAVSGGAGAPRPPHVPPPLPPRPRARERSATTTTTSTTTEATSSDVSGPRTATGEALRRRRGPMVELKLVLFGQVGCGKTRLADRFVCVGKHDRRRQEDGSGSVTAVDEEEEVQPTVGASYLVKLISLHGTRVKCSLWDVSGRDCAPIVGAPGWRLLTLWCCTHCLLCRRRTLCRSPGAYVLSGRARGALCVRRDGYQVVHLRQETHRYAALPPPEVWTRTYGCRKCRGGDDQPEELVRGDPGRHQVRQAKRKAGPGIRSQVVGGRMSTKLSLSLIECTSHLPSALPEQANQLP